MMNKQCRNCGTMVPNEYAFCNICGGSDFVVAEAQPQVNMNQPQTNAYNQYQPNNYNNQPTGYQQMPVDQPWQPVAPQGPQFAQNPQPPKKKKKTGCIVGIIIALLVGALIFGIIGIGIIAGCVENSENDGGYSVGDSSNESVPYTKGTFDGSVYVNEWADIEFTLPESYENAESSFYTSAENENTDCGGYFMSAEKGSFIYFCFEKLPSFPVIDEEDYMDILMENYATEIGGQCTTADTYFTESIGGYTYKKASCEFTTAGQTFQNDIYVRKIGDRMVSIFAVSIDSADNDEMIEQITKVQ